MDSLSFEIKARCPDPSRIRKILLARGASFKGLDCQVDTYFRVPSGRLKLREGNIENALIYYKRVDQKRSKKCDATLFPCKKKTPLKKLLTVAFGVLTVVDKKREIYFIQNTKFHIDRVERLGNFVEIEVFGRKESPGVAKLRKQCKFYQKLLGIRTQELVADSYSDQLLKMVQSSTHNARRKNRTLRLARCA
ncbi:MAG: class IV adenylate cyclase [Candidatus Omnitrophota bacterium]